MHVALISHPDCRKHEMGARHPERPARLDAINDQLRASGLDGLLAHYNAPAATREQLERVHDADYIDWIYERAPKEGVVWLDPDTGMNEFSLSAALHAAGAVVNGVDLVMSGKAKAVFCLVRPCGHHAERRRAMGFCLFNNIAVGAAHALAVHGIDRVAIVDFDVHHGNGTEEIFRNEARVLFCSSFQHPFYPGAGADTVSDHIINIPLPAGARGNDFRAAVESRWLEALDTFRPQLLMVSAGFDAHAEDHMAMLNLVEADYAWITDQIKRIADRHAEGRIVSALEGGYDLSALGRSVTSHLNHLIGNRG
jgi:acetoin utilization deacetylase AcuC-like enzyme